MKDVCFVICTEKGRLEKQSLLLVDSLRRFGGRYRNADILSFSPRRGCKPSQQTGEKLAKQGVIIVTHDLNHSYADYPIANKLIAAAYVEQHFDYERIVMLDSDILFFNEPSLVDIPTGFDIALRPVHRKNIGVGKNEPIPPDWQKVFELFGVTSHRFVRTTVDNEEIYAYWNSGFIVSRSSAGFFSRLLHNFTLFVDNVKLLNNKMLYFRDQIVVAATIEQMRLSYFVLPASYNVPFGYKRHYPGKPTDLSSVVFLHYHRRFEQSFFINPLRRNFRSDEAMRWATCKTKEHKVFVVSVWGFLKKYIRRPVGLLKRFTLRYILIVFGIGLFL